MWPRQLCPCTRSQLVPETKIISYIIINLGAWCCSAMITQTSKCTYQFELVCTEENRCPSPIQSQLCAVENQSCPPLSLEPSALPVYQIAGIAHAGIQCCPSWTKYPVRRTKPWLLQSLKKRANFDGNKNVIFCTYVLPVSDSVLTLYHVLILFLVIWLPINPPINGNKVAPMAS